MIYLAKLFGGLFLGWGIGANDSANIFGTAVATNSVRYKTAIILIAIFAVMGSVIEGPKLYAGYNFSSAATTLELAFIATFASALTLLMLTYFGFPASCSQAGVGGMMGIAILSSGMAGVEWAKLGAWICCWVLNPLGAAVVAFILMKAGGSLIQRYVKNMVLLNQIYKIGLIIFGCYGAYNLGANNVVVSTGPFFKAGFFGNPALRQAVVIAATVGGLSIALGTLTYSKKVMMTVGKEITVLDPFSALVAVLAHSIAMHFFTEMHVPVSSSQAIVGAVAGIGLTKGMRTMNSRVLFSIICAWFLTPVVAAVLAVGIALIFGIKG